MEHGRFAYSPIVDRPPLRFPNGARVAVWVVPNIEHFRWDQPSTSIAPLTAGLKPDVLNYAWRDFGVRVGVWRMMEIMERHGFRGTVALNSDVCVHYPRIVEAACGLGWEHMGHGQTNSVWLGSQSEDEERALVRETLATIAGVTGRRPKGWLSPSLTESQRTPDILAAEGVEYLADWANDEQPYAMCVASGSLISLPYSIEINDITVFLGNQGTAEDFERRVVDQFDWLYEDGRKSGRVMAIALHPFLIGHAFRAGALDRALAHIRQRSHVWLATGSELNAWYRKAVSDTDS